MVFRELMLYSSYLYIFQIQFLEASDITYLAEFLIRHQRSESMKWSALKMEEDITEKGKGLNYLGAEMNLINHSLS